MIFEANKTDKYIIVINNFNLKLNILKFIINIKGMEWLQRNNLKMC